MALFNKDNLEKDSKLKIGHIYAPYISVDEFWGWSEEDKEEDEEYWDEDEEEYI